MSAHLPTEIDAGAVGIAPADLIFVFGTRLRHPVLLAAGLFGRSLAPRIVVTGGSSRQVDGLNEADHHCAVLMELGVPRDAIGRREHFIEHGRERCVRPTSAGAAPAT